MFVYVIVATVFAAAAAWSCPLRTLTRRRRVEGS